MDILRFALDSALDSALDFALGLGTLQGDLWRKPRFYLAMKSLYLGLMRTEVFLDK
jgi:hypothetical protein